MSFSLKKIKKKQKIRKNQTISGLFVYIRELDNISEDVRKALRGFLSAYLYKNGLSGLTIYKWNLLVTGLLENCCNKKLVDITPSDTDNNFGSIINKLQLAIKKNNLDVLYTSSSTKVELDVDLLDLSMLFNKDKRSVLTDIDYENLFGGIL